jgi:hypothetical protein
VLHVCLDEISGSCERFSIPEYLHFKDIRDSVELVSLCFVRTQTLNIPGVATIGEKLKKTSLAGSAGRLVMGKNRVIA